MKKNIDAVHSAVMDAVSIEPMALDEEFSKIPSLLASFNEQYADAYRKHLVAKHGVDRSYAACYLRHREEAEARGEKVTEGLLKARVDADEQYHAAQDRAISAEVEKLRLWGVLDALRAKRDALISIGAHLRAEMQGNPSIRGDRRGARDVSGNFSSDDDFGVEVDG